MEGKLASLLSLIMIRINGGQGLLDEDTSLSHVYESLLTYVDKVLHCFVMLVKLWIKLDKVLHVDH